MVEVGEVEAPLQVVDGVARRELVRAEALEDHAAHALGRPQPRDGVGAPIVLRPAGIGVEGVHDAVRVRIAHDAIEQARLFSRGVAPADHEAVVAADVGGVGVREVELAVLLLDVRRQIVHGRAPAKRGRRPVVHEAERVAHLVGGEVAQPGEDEGRLVHAGITGREPRRVGRFTGQARAGRRLHILPNARRRPPAMRVDAGHRVQDLAGPGVGLGVSHRPGAFRAVDPFDPRVARVEERRALRQVADYERLAEAGFRERVVPPERAFLHRRALRLGYPPVEVVHERLAVLHPPARGEVALDRLGERRGVVEVAHGDEADPYVERAGNVPGLGKLEERVVHAEAHGAAVGEHVRDRPRGLVGGEREERLDLGVAREGAAAVEVERGARPVLPPLAQAGLAELGRDPSVPQQELGGVDEHAPGVLGDDGQRGQHGRGERLLDDPGALGVGDAAAVGSLPLVQEHARPHALEAHEAQVAELPAIERHLEQPRPAGQPGAVEQILSEPRHLEEELALRRVPVEGHEAVVAFEAGRPFAHRRGLVGGGEQGRSREGQDQGRRYESHRSSGTVAERSRRPRRGPSSMFKPLTSERSFATLGPRTREWPSHPASVSPAVRTSRSARRSFAGNCVRAPPCRAAGSRVIWG